MDITVKIAQIGKACGTLGWLLDGLQSGELRLEEGERKIDKHHGLWLKSRDGKLSQLLAIYDYWGVSGQTDEERKYKTVRGTDCRGDSFTDAAWEALMDIGRQWACACNEAEEQAEEQYANERVRIVRTTS